MKKDICVSIRMKDGPSASWNLLLQKGFYLQGLSGMSLRHFLMEVMGYTDAFIDETVRTIFLNNSPVDDIDNAFIKEGDRIALGSAMPGLVGIVMGRDNPFKSFRSDISNLDKRSDDHEATVTVGMKVFSVLAKDTGRDILERGILVDAEQLADFLETKGDSVLEADSGPVDEFIGRLRESSDRTWVTVAFE